MWVVQWHIAVAPRAVLVCTHPLNSDECPVQFGQLRTDVSDMSDSRSEWAVTQSPSSVLSAAIASVTLCWSYRSRADRHWSTSGPVHGQTHHWRTEHAVRILGCEGRLCSDVERGGDAHVRPIGPQRESVEEVHNLAVRCGICQWHCVRLRLDRHCINYFIGFKPP